MTHRGQLIAVKQVELPTTSLDEAKRVYEGLQREVDILKEMRHPNIVRYVFIGFLVLEKFQLFINDG